VCAVEAVNDLSGILSALSDIDFHQLVWPHVMLVDDEVEAIKAMTADPEGTATVWAQPSGAGQPIRICRMMLPAVGQAAGLARQRTQEALTLWQLGRLEETAVLLVSELVRAEKRIHGSDQQSCSPSFPP
jgi:hypothetical protein